MITKQIYNDTLCASCYFRSIAEFPYKKALLQITERCNLRCKHCFVSSNTSGEEMSFDNIKNIIIPMLIDNNVKKVTLTGGEPFVHSRLIDIVKILDQFGFEICICTNATLITSEFLDDIKNITSIHFNVSLDGFSNNSHGKFRGNTDDSVYNRIIDNISTLGNMNLLNGILVTPNIYSNIAEYVKICEFAKRIKAKYVLMNPLSQFGRGEDTYSLGFPIQKMIELRQITEQYNSDNFEVVYIRFPNTEKKKLGDCVERKILYIFTNGDIAICPYMVFASKTNTSKYKPEEFLLGNVFDATFNLESKLEQYKFPTRDHKGLCSKCNINDCSGGCFASKISSGLYLDDCDIELCPL